MLLLVWFISPGERTRRERVERLQLGDGEPRVTALLGAAAARCPAGTLAHLRDSFPPGWPGASLETALQGLAAGTSERLIFPLEAEDGAGCEPRDGNTEIGLDAEGRVFWYVALLGETPLRLPEGFAPAEPPDTSGN